MAEIKVYPKDLVTKTLRSGKIAIGMVDRVAGIDSDSDSEFEDDAPLDNGMIRVTWYPRAANEKINENKVTVVDRSCLPRDVVRMKNGNQLGTVTNVFVFADLMPLGTRKVLEIIPVQWCTQFLPFLEDDIVVLNNWYGRVNNITGYYILKFPNNARYSFPFMKRVAFEEMNPNESDFGGFCHEIYNMYTGQKLVGSGSSFGEANWISGPKIKFKKRMRYMFIVDKMQLSSATVKWMNDCGNPAILIPKVGEKPCDVVVGSQLEKLQSLNTFWSGHVYVGDRLQHKLSKEDADCLNQQEDIKFQLTIKKKRRKRKCRRVNFSASSLTTTPNPKQDQTSKKVAENNEEVLDESTDNESQDDNEEKNEDNEDAGDEVENKNMNDETSKPDGDNQLLPVDEHNATDVAVITYDYVLAIKLLGHVAMYALMKSGTTEFTIHIDAPKSILTQKPVPTGMLHVALPVPSDENYDKYDYFTSLITMFIAHKDQMFRECKEFQYWMKLKNRYVKGSVDASYTKTEETDHDINSKDHPMNQENLLKVTKKLDDDDEEPNEQTTSQVVERSPEYKEGDVISVEVKRTRSFVDIQWQDGSLSSCVSTIDVCAAHHVDQNDFCPGDFVIDKRTRVAEITKNYGLVVTANASTRMVDVKWFKNEFPEEDIETISAYDLADHPLFTFRISDIIYNHRQQKENASKESALVGELLGVNCNGFLDVLWSDGVKGTIRPQDVTSYVPDDDSEGSDSDDSSNGSDSSWVSISIHTDDDESSTPQTDKSVAMDLTEETTTAGHEERLSTNDNTEINELEPEEEMEQGDVTNEIYKDFKYIDDDLTSPEDEVGGQKAIKRCNNTTTSVPNEEPTSVPNEEPTSVPNEESTSVPNEEASNEENDMDIQQQQVQCLPEVFMSHRYATLKLEMANQKSFMKAINRDMNLLKSSQSQGIDVKIYEDKLHLLSVMIKGPEKTPYQHGLFFLDVMFPATYPNDPPAVHYISYSPRINPNLYENGTVCVSLLGTWRGKGNEKWTKESNILQVLLSVQGLILNAEPYYNEAGYEGHRGTSEGMRNSRSYNEMVLLRMVQHLTNLIKNPPKPFETETIAYCKEHAPLFIKFVTDIITASGDQAENIQKNLDYPLLPISKGCLESLHGKLKDLNSTVSKKLDLDI